MTDTTGSVTTGKHDRLIEFDHLVMHQRNDPINARAILCLCPIMNASLESPIILLFIWVGSARTWVTCPPLVCYVVVNIDRSLFMKLYCVHFANAIPPRGSVFKQPNKQTQKPACLPLKPLILD